MNEQQPVCPLVSVIVITFNSSKYVIETLESAKAQTYENIELIVSDDCSTDSTVEICKNWLLRNSERFFKVEMVTSTKNSGIPSNCNRGLNVANGEWLKFIGGDDILLPDCIYFLINGLSKYKESEIGLVHGRMYYIDTNSDIIGESKNKNRELFPNFNEEFRSNKILSPTVLFNHNILNEIHGFNSEYKIEDIWIFLKLLSLNKKSIYVNRQLVKYRIHESNISKNDPLMCQEHIKILRSFDKNFKNKFNFYLFSKAVLISKILRKDSVFEYYRLFYKETFTAFLVFFDIDFWFKLIKGFLKQNFI